MKEKRSVICIILCVLLISMLGLTACKKDKETDAEGLIAVDLELEDVEVNVPVFKGGKLDDSVEGTFLLLHKFEEIDVSIYYYEEYKYVLEQEVHIEYIVLEKAGFYETWIIPVDNVLLGSDDNMYECYDYDDDGISEIAVTFVLSESNLHKDQKLFIFDYNESKNSYDMYCLGLKELISGVFIDAIIEFYNKQYGIEYLYGTYGGANEGIASRVEFDSYFEGGMHVQCGSHTDIRLSDDGEVEISMSVFEVIDNIDREGSDYTTPAIIFDKEIDVIEGDESVKKEVRFIGVGAVNCSVKYMDDGKFMVNASEYKDYTYKRG